MTCGITARHSPASVHVTCQLHVCQYTKRCLSNTCQVFWHRPPRAGHQGTPGRGTKMTFLPESSFRHINASLAPTPHFKHLRSAPLVKVWFSAAEWKDEGYPMVKIQKDQRKPMIHEKLWFQFSADQVASQISIKVQSAQNLNSLKCSLRPVISCYKQGWRNPTPACSFGVKEQLFGCNIAPAEGNNVCSDFVTLLQAHPSPHSSNCMLCLKTLCFKANAIFSCNKIPNPGNSNPQMQVMMAVVETELTEGFLHIASCGKGVCREFSKPDRRLTYLCVNSEIRNADLETPWDRTGIERQKWN